MPGCWPHASPPDPPVDQLTLQRGKETLGHSVVVGIPDGAHGGAHPPRRRHLMWLNARSWSNCGASCVKSRWKETSWQRLRPGLREKARRRLQRLQARESKPGRFARARAKAATPSPPRRHVFRSGTAPVFIEAAPNIINTNYEIRAEVDIPEQGANGMILAHGGASAAMVSSSMRGGPASSIATTASTRHASRPRRRSLRGSTPFALSSRKPALQILLRGTALLGSVACTSMMNASRRRPSTPLHRP